MWSKEEARKAPPTIRAFGFPALLSRQDGVKSNMEANMRSVNKEEIFSFFYCLPGSCEILCCRHLKQSKLLLSPPPPPALLDWKGVDKKLLTTAPCRSGED
ncbi:MAG: hypothetical protein U9P36_11115 [Thermodesulfobacteriota bacterium]|nr:hypothetical protein [Thermodesulfobacteriota bacterium]